MSKIILETKVSVDNYTEYVCDKFDLQTREHIVTEVPMINLDELSTFSWNIGLICGNSVVESPQFLIRLVLNQFQLMIWIKL